MKVKHVPNIPAEFVALFNVGQKTDSHIAGGSVRSLIAGETPRDVDFFQTHPEHHQKLVDNLKTLGYQVQFDNQMTTRMIKEGAVSVDCVKPREAEHLKTFGTLEEILSRFDFTVCAAGLTSAELMSPITALVHDDFDEDVNKKRLRIFHVTCPISSVKRIAKYAAKGFSISTTEIFKLFRAWSERSSHATAVSGLLEMVLAGKELTPEQQAQLGLLLYID